MTPSGFLHRRDGVACSPVAFSSAILSDEHLGDILALYGTVRATIRADLFAEEADGFFPDHLARIGRILGLFAEDTLIAYGVLGLPGPGDVNFADMIDLAEPQRQGVAHIDGAAVCPEWRGNGVHRVLVAWRLERAREAGRSIALSTAAPENLPCVGNLLAEGFDIHALIQKFGGWRYVFRRDLDTAPSRTDGGIWAEVSDMDTQRDLLRRGFVGRRLDGHRVSYALR